MLVNKTWLLALAILVLGGAGAIFYWRSGAVASLPQEAPYLVGQITRYEGGRILVEAVPGKQEGGKCWFAVSAKTRIFRQEQGAAVKADAASLATGQQVQTWTFGPVAESYPCQGGADVVLILAR